MAAVPPSPSLPRWPTSRSESSCKRTFSYEKFRILHYTIKHRIDPHSFPKRSSNHADHMTNILSSAYISPTTIPFIVEAFRKTSTLATVQHLSLSRKIKSKRQKLNHYNRTETRKRLMHARSLQAEASSPSTENQIRLPHRKLSHYLQPKSRSP